LKDGCSAVHGHVMEVHGFMVATLASIDAYLEKGKIMIRKEHGQPATEQI
jgi:hypothetical protein